jgi:hypothetical protein
MPTNPSAIVDAIQTDLVTLGLNPKKTWSYVEPTVIMPTNCPLLAVWCQTSDYQILTGGLGAEAYERSHLVVIEWVVYSPTMADTGGTGDPTTVQALDAITEQLVNRAASYSAGLPGGLGPQMIATLQQRQIVAKAGDLWSAQIHLTAEEAS